MSQPDFTIADVLAWARTKPADERYRYTDARSCAVAQFGIETQRPHLIGLYSWELEAIDPALLSAVNPGGAESDYTFGALVARLEKLCPDAPVPQSDWAKLDAYLTDIEQVQSCTA